MFRFSCKLPCSLTHTNWKKQNLPRANQEENVFKAQWQISACGRLRISPVFEVAPPPPHRTDSVITQSILYSQLKERPSSTAIDGIFFFFFFTKFPLLISMEDLGSWAEEGPRNRAGNKELALTSEGTMGH